jgi:putative Mn2+ efflux pump MntP
MGIGFIVLLAIGLSMDCFAVSVTGGIVGNKPKISQYLRMATLFGLFQAMMPLIGFFAGHVFAEQIQRVDHWLAFVLLLVIGGKMMYSDIQWKKKDTTDQKRDDYYKITMLLSLAMATSIDALATGLIFVPFENRIGWAVVTIGVCSFLFSLIGSYVGSYCNGKIRVRAELFGGIILVAIGTKILIEHLITE